MSVRIPIQTDASQTLQAIESIRSALRASSGDAQTLANVDLSNLGSKELAADLERIVNNMANIAQMGRSDVSVGARKVFGRNPSIADLSALEAAGAALYPGDANGAAKWVRNYGDAALGGTRFDPKNPNNVLPPPPPNDNPPPPPPPPPPEPEGGGKKIMDSLKSGLMTGLGFFLAQAGIGSVVGVASSAVQAGESENQNTDRLLRRTGDLATSFDQLIKTSDYLHRGLLISRIDFEQYADSFGSASGGISAASAMRGARLAVGQAQSAGADPAGFARGFGQANFLGVSPDKFAEMIGESAVRGSMGGRIEEVMGALLHATETASRVNATRDGVTGAVGGFVDLYTAMNASRSPMFAGANGVNTIDAVNNAITNGGGGGMAGQVLMMRAMMSAGIKDPYAVQMQLAGGAFARVGKNGPTNFELAESELKKEYDPLDKTGNRAAIAAGMFFNLNPRVAQSLMALPNSHVDLGALEDTLKPYGGINGIDPTSLNDIIRIQSGQTSFSGLQSMRSRLLKNKGISQANADGLNSATDESSLRSALISTLAQTGMPQTDQTRATEATVKLTDALTTLGHPLVDAISILKDKMAGLADAVGPIAEWAAKQMQPDDANMDDGHVKFGIQSPELFPGANRDSADPSATSGGPRALAQHVDRYSSLLARIGQAESGLGTNPAAHGNVYGLIGSTWLDDIKRLARTDPEVAGAIAGKSDEQIKALRDMSHTELQRKVAAFGVNEIRQKLGSHASDMDVYAAWASGLGSGPGIMHASDDTPLSHFFNSAGLAANPTYRNMTVGQWKASHRDMFPDIAGSAYGGTGNAAGGQWKARHRDMFPDIAGAIAGKSDEQIKALRDMSHTELQRKVAAFAVNEIRQKLGSHASDMDVYAAWASGLGSGPGIMHASDDTPMSQFFNSAGLAANPTYRNMTVGQWKARHREMFPDIAGSAYGGTGNAAGGQIRVIAPEPLHIILRDAKGRVHAEQMAHFGTAWDGQATPHGTGQPPTRSPAAHPSIAKNPLSPAMPDYSHGY